jgi:hypothetical protein
MVDATQLDVRGSIPVACLQFRDLHAQDAVARNAGLLLGRASGRPPAQPLGLAPQGVLQHRLTLLLGRQRLRPDLDIALVAAVYSQQAARVALVELQNSVGYPL